ncbi:hypothetical protein H1R20_g292, partial [Candolleomyces eurysporus]
MRSLSVVENGPGINSQNWEDTRYIFDGCPNLHLSKPGKRNHIELSSRSYGRSSVGTGGDVIERLQKLIGDRDVSSDLSFDLNTVTGSLASPLQELGRGMPAENRAFGGESVKLRQESTFLDTSVLLYIDPDHPYIKIYRLHLVASTEFKRKDRPPTAWDLTGAYDSCIYVPGADFLETYRSEAQRLGQQETQDLLARLQ